VFVSHGGFPHEERESSLLIEFEDFDFYQLSDG
jgi:hypothetical protein